MAFLDAEWNLVDRQYRSVSFAEVFKSKDGFQDKNIWRLDGQVREMLRKLFMVLAVVII